MTDTSNILSFQVDEKLSEALAKYREIRRRHTLLSSFAAEPALFIQEVVKLFGQEIRVNVTKDNETPDQGEVLGSGEAYGERWVPDAVQRLYMRMIEERRMQQQVIQQQVMQMAREAGNGGGEAAAGGGEAAAGGGSSQDVQK